MCGENGKLRYGYSSDIEILVCRDMNLGHLRWTETLKEATHLHFDSMADGRRRRRRRRRCMRVYPGTVYRMNGNLLTHLSRFCCILFLSFSASRLFIARLLILCINGTERKSGFPLHSESINRNTHPHSDIHCDFPNWKMKRNTYCLVDRDWDDEVRLLTEKDMFRR